MHVLGTAGHVDHGKSTLVRALTGIDPDRLREEKERGLTIDLGFAWLPLPSGREVSIVDVPGHERFIKNMLAGAGGVDLALLVVAADEGPMPQTREHLAILDLLDVPAGIIVITKADLADAEYVDLVEAELEELVAGTRLAGAPVVRTSAQSGMGLDDLKRAIDTALEQTPTRRDLGRPRLPIDRAFTIQGFGAVVTGTLVDGAFDAGQEVEVQPGGTRARIRGLQRHRSKVSRLEPGTRAAVNLSGIHTEDLERGMVLALPGTIFPAYAVDIRLRATNLLPHAVAHDAGITFLSATSESEGKLRLLDREELLPGDEAWAQVVLAKEIAVARGDHFVIRTPNDTIGGGRIVAVNPKRHRRNHEPTLEVLRRLLDGSPSERLLDILLLAPRPVATAKRLLDLDDDAFREALAELESRNEATTHGDRLYATSWLDSAVGRMVAEATDYLAANPLRPRPLANMSGRARESKSADFDLIIGRAIAEGRLEERLAGLAPAGYEIVLSEKQQTEVDQFMASITNGGFSPPTEKLPAPGLLALLVAQERVVDTGAGVIFESRVFAEMQTLVVTFAQQNGQVTLAETRDLLGNSRKYAQAFLEALDNRKVTRRTGDIRTLR